MHDLEIAQLQRRYTDLRVMDPGRVGRLAASIAEEGQRSPVLVVGDVLIDGYHRVQALAEVEAGSPITFEWIGHEDYLGEARGKPRERGRYCTSADALLVAVRADGGSTAVLVEWKFTELYDKPVAVRTATTDRREVYRARYEADVSPLVERPALDLYFHESHYPLLRQALLAGAMVDAREFGIDRAVMLHLVPGRHHTLREFVPPGLRELGSTIEDVRSRLLPTSNLGYRMADNQPLLQACPEIAERYGEFGS